MIQRLLIFILCLPVLGNAQQWLWKAGSVNLDEATDIVSHNNLYTTCGLFSGTCNFEIQSFSSSGATDVFVLRSDANGAPLWVKKFGGSGNERAVSVAQADGDAVVVCGLYSGTVNFGGTTLTSAGGSDVFILKLDAGGNVLWAKSAGGPNDDAAYSIDANPANGQVAVTGEFTGTAQFGGTSFTSNNNSPDIWLAKLDASGNWMWAKQGSATNQDKGTAVCLAPDNAVYLCGQFSDTLTFDQVHNNQSLNAGFVAKFNDGGTEQWFSRILANAVLPADILFDGGNLFVTGESIGQLIFFGTNMVVVDAAFPYSLFLARYSISGAVDWATEDGSESYVAANSLADSDGDMVHVAGVFECTLSEYADEMGSGLFNSSGYRDVFVVQYSHTGNRLVMRPFGGPDDDGLGGVTSTGAIAGGFEKFFHVPSDDTFIDNATNWEAPDFSPLYYPNPGGAICGWNSLNTFVTAEATGSRDIYVSTAFSESLPPYPLYYTEGDCQYNYFDPCINSFSNYTYNETCEDSLEVCEFTWLYWHRHTGYNNFVGPQFEFEWNTGASIDSIYVDETGLYTVEWERADGCASGIDSIYVEVYPAVVPVVSDSQGYLVEAPPLQNDLPVCEFPVTLTAGNFEDATTFYWIVDGQEIEAESITITEPGDYTFFATNEFGCGYSNTIQAWQIEPLDTAAPALGIGGFDVVSGDTITFCDGENVDFLLYDLMEQEQFPFYVEAWWNVYFNGSLIFEIEEVPAIVVNPSESGWYEVVADPYLFSPPPCPADTTWYPQLSFEIYIDLLPAPSPNPIITGLTNICPGDTLLLVASGEDNYIWFGPIYEFLSEDSVLVVNPGTYSVSSYEAFENGCDAFGSDMHVVIEPPSPLIISDPLVAVICPGGTIELTCDAGQSYQWVGPLGQDLGSAQSITVSEPGEYYCIQTNALGCTMESNIIDVLNYATPSLELWPSADLCNFDFITITLLVNPQADWQWLPPLTGTSLTMAINEPGIYSATVTFCDITSEVSVEVIQTPLEPVISAAQDFICPGGSLTLFAPAGEFEYSWNPGNESSASLLVTQAGTYSVEVADTNGCEGVSQEFIVTQYELDIPEAESIWVCLGEQAQLTAQSSDEVFWANDFLGENVVAIGETFITDPVFVPATYYVFVSDENCESLPVEVVVSIYPSSVPPTAEGDTNYCAGEDISLIATAADGVEVEWTFPNGDTSDQISFTIENAGPEYNGWFTVQAIDFNCTSAPDSIFITVENPDNDALIAEDEIALCINAFLSIETTIAIDQPVWQTPQGEVQTPSIEIEEVDWQDEGLYYITTPGLYCAFHFDSVWVDVVEYPVISLVDSVIYCDNGYMMAHLQEGFDVYAWSNGDTDNLAIVPVNGYLSVVVTNLPDCSTFAEVQLDEIDCFIDFPNIFTPNSDGENDGIDFGILRIPVDEVFIYNRWGKLIKHITSSPWIWWGETEGGNLVSEGVYYYVLHSPLPGKHYHNVEGYIHVVYTN